VSLKVVEKRDFNWKQMSALFSVYGVIASLFSVYGIYEKSSDNMEGSSLKSLVSLDSFSNSSDFRYEKGSLQMQLKSSTSLVYLERS